MLKSKLTITIISVIALIICLSMYIFAYDYTNSEPYIEGYTVDKSEFGNISCNFYTNSFFYRTTDYNMGSNFKTTYDFLIDFNLFQSDFTDSYSDFGNWMDNNGIDEVTPLTWKSYVLDRETNVNDIYITINSSSTVYGNIEQTLNSYSNFAYTLYYLAYLEINKGELETENNRLINEYNNLQTENGQLREENSNLTNSYNELTETLDDLQTENGQLREENSNLTNSYNELTETLDDLQTENGELSSSLTQLGNNYDTLERAYGELETENNRLNNENSELREQLKDVDGYQDGYNQALSDTNAFKKGILFIMSSPSVIFSNMFNYDIFGINLYHIIQVLFTILVVSFAFGLIFKYIL